MGVEIFYPWVENVVEAILTHKNVWKDPYAFEDGIIEVLEAPHQLQIVDWVYFLFMLFEVVQQIGDSHLLFLQDWLHYIQVFLDVFLDKTQDSFAVVFGDIFCFIFFIILV